MREILFRGKRKDNGKWVEGFYTQKMNPYTPDGLPIKHFILDLAPFGVDVLPETVRQYTGLTDKNGVRIFEGDIVERVSDGERAVISWLKYSACFGLSFDGWCCGFDDYDFSLNDFKVTRNSQNSKSVTHAFTSFADTKTCTKERFYLNRKEVIL